MNHEDCTSIGSSSVVSKFWIRNCAALAPFCGFVSVFEDVFDREYGIRAVAGDLGGSFGRDRTSVVGRWRSRGGSLEEVNEDRAPESVL